MAQLLGADDYLDAAFQHPDHDAPVLLFSAWYANQNGGAGIHSPEVCLPAGGWEIATRRKPRPPEAGRCPNR
ncbi:MAG: exosortase C-terminal domain/associated protein EpsI [Pseudomonadota bacterium]